MILDSGLLFLGHPVYLVAMYNVFAYVCYESVRPYRLA